MVRVDVDRECLPGQSNPEASDLPGSGTAGSGPPTLGSAHYDRMVAPAGRGAPHRLRRLLRRGGVFSRGAGPPDRPTGGGCRGHRGAPRAHVAAHPVDAAVGRPGGHHPHHAAHRLHRRARHRWSDPGPPARPRRADVRGARRLDHGRDAPGHRGLDDRRRARPAVPRSVGSVAHRQGRHPPGPDVQHPRQAPHRRAQRLGQRLPAPARHRAPGGALGGPHPAGAGLHGAPLRRGRDHRRGHRPAAHPVAGLRRADRRRRDDPPGPLRDGRAGRVGRGRADARPADRALPLPGDRGRPGRRGRRRARQAGPRRAPRASAGGAGVRPDGRRAARARDDPARPPPAPAPPAQLPDGRRPRRVWRNLRRGHPGGRDRGDCRRGRRRARPPRTPGPRPPRRHLDGARPVAHRRGPRPRGRDHPRGVDLRDPGRFRHGPARPGARGRRRGRDRGLAPHGRGHGRPTGRPAPAGGTRRPAQGGEGPGETGAPGASSGIRQQEETR